MTHQKFLVCITPTAYWWKYWTPVKNARASDYKTSYFQQHCIYEFLANSPIHSETMELLKFVVLVVAFVYLTMASFVEGVQHRIRTVCTDAVGYQS